MPELEFALCHAVVTLLSRCGGRVDHSGVRSASDVTAMWSSGSLPVLHAEGPGFESQ